MTYARLGGGYSTLADFTLTGANESDLIRQILQTFDPSWRRLEFSFCLSESTDNILSSGKSNRCSWDSFNPTTTDNGAGAFSLLIRTMGSPGQLEASGEHEKLWR